MVKCWQCNGELTFRPISKSEIILKCSDENCGFESLPIKLDPLFKPVEITQVPEVIAVKTSSVEKTKEGERTKEIITISKDIEYEKKYDYIFEQESSVPQVILTRKGGLNKFSIFCLDFSNHMDKELPVMVEDLDIWKKRINSDDILPQIIKDKLIELTIPPISYFRATLLAFSFLILENIKKMTVEDFHSFQIISMAGESEEVFRFPNFQKQTTPQIILDFINIITIRRQEYRSNELLKYRDYTLTLGTVTELLKEIRESYPDQLIQIFLLTMGSHRSFEQQPINPIMEIKKFLGDHEPFSFNIIHFAINASERIFQQIVRRFNGFFSKEITFKSIMNSITYHKYETDVLSEIKIPKKILKKIPEKLEEIFKEEKPIFSEDITEQKSIAEIEEDFNKQKSISIKDWDKDITSFSIENEADDILKKLIDNEEMEE